MLLQALPGWQEHGYRLKCLTRNHKALAFYAASGFVTLGEGKSDEGTYHLLERKAAWPQPQAHRCRGADLLFAGRGFHPYAGKNNNHGGQQE